MQWWSSLLIAPALAAVLGGCGDGLRAATTAAPSPSRDSWQQDCGVTGYKQHPHLADDSAYDAEGYVGLSLDEAERRAEAAQLDLRVLGVDGDCFDRTDDHRSDRVNAYVEAGLVRSAARY